MSAVSLLPLFLREQLIENNQPPLSGVVLHPIKGPRVWVVPPVKTVVYAVECGDFLVRNFPLYNVLKYIAAGSRWLSQVLMPIRPFVGFFQMLGLNQKLLA